MFGIYRQAGVGAFVSVKDETALTGVDVSALTLGTFAFVIIEGIYFQLVTDGSNDLMWQEVVFGAPAILSVAGIATGATQLSTLPSANYDQGALAWVQTVGAYFELRQSSLATDGITVIAASGKAGYQWVRVPARNLVWEAQANWAVDTVNGNDENDGTVAPLKTMSELARRLAFAQYGATAFITVTLSGDMAVSDVPLFTWDCEPGAFFFIVGMPTTLFSGTVTTYTAPSAAPATDDPQLVVSSLPVSWTASGLMAPGVYCKRTSGGNGTGWWIAKDLGSKTARISIQFNNATEAPIAAGNGFSALKLPLVQQLRFSTQVGSCVFLQNVMTAPNCLWNDPSLIFKQSWVQGPCTMGAVASINAAFGPGPITIAGYPLGGQDSGFVGGMFRGSGSDAITFAQNNSSSQGRILLQGVALRFFTATLALFGGSLLAYDSGGPIAVQENSKLILEAAMSGNNNAALVSVSKGSQILHTASPQWVAGSSPSATPIGIAGTGSISVSSETSGGGALNTQMNGVFATS